MRERRLVMKRKSLAGFVDYVNNSPDALNNLLRVGIVLPFLLFSFFSMWFFWIGYLFWGCVFFVLAFISWRRGKENVALFRERTPFKMNIQSFVYGRKKWP